MIVYIMEEEKPNLLHKAFNILRIKEFENKTIIKVPINLKSLKFKIEQNAKKLSEFLYNNNIINIAISRNLMQNDTFKNILYSNNINILNGTRLSRYLTYNIIEKILEYKNIKVETAEVTILVNNNDNINTENIIKIAKNVKRLNILTRDLKVFRNVADYLYEELGILIKLSNNININLKRTDIILNIDFPEETINKLDLPIHSTIVSIPYNIDIKAKRFAGINIKSWEMIIPPKYKFDGFEDNIMYESILYNMSAKEAFANIKKDNIIIKELIGKNGRINRKEFIQNL